jgi:hypothetical protein
VEHYCIFYDGLMNLPNKSETQDYESMELIMDENVLLEKLAEELITGWEAIPTGSGFLVTTAWRWPDGEMIEIYVRSVADRDDLYLVTDGGELINFLFSRGIDLRGDDRSMEILHDITESSGTKIVDYQIVKGAGMQDLARAIRQVLEAVKEGAFVFWHSLSAKSN